MNINQLTQEHISHTIDREPEAWSRFRALFDEWPMEWAEECSDERVPLTQHGEIHTQARAMREMLEDPSLSPYNRRLAQQVLAGLEIATEWLKLTKAQRAWFSRKGYDYNSGGFQLGMSALYFQANFRDCEICGKEFETQYDQQKTCGPVCRKENEKRKARLRARKSSKRRKHQGVDKEKTRLRVQRFRERNQQEKVCVICGDTFTTAKETTRTCNPVCKGEWANLVRLGRQERYLRRKGLA